MAVVEYRLHRVNGKNLRHVPDFIGDRGHWYNPTDNTYIGWIDDNRDYYVPDTIVSLTKEELVQRQLNIHSSTPLSKMEGDETTGEITQTEMTVEEVRSEVEQWYDDFVDDNS